MNPNADASIHSTILLTAHATEARTKNSSDRWAWAIWLILLIVVSTWVVATGNRRSVTESYRLAAQRWWAGEALYKPKDNIVIFLYLPPAALVYTPYAALPFTLGEVLWRVTTIGSFAWALSRLCALIGRQTGRELFLVATLVTLPLSWSSARNGQATLPMAALMILAAVDVVERRWRLAALWLWLGVAVKPLAIVMVLLLGALHAPLRWRLAIGLACLLLIPFFCQAPPYVVSQYVECVHMLRTESNEGLRAVWAQLFTLLEICGLATPPAVQTIVRLLAAAATLALAIRAHATWPRAWAAAHTFALVACYLMLFNPRTENNTYSCLAPAIGLAVATSWGVPGSGWFAALSAASALAIVSSWQLGKLLVPDVPPVWLAPLGAAFFTGLTIKRIFAGPQQADLGQPVAPELADNLAEGEVRRLAA